LLPNNNKFEGATPTKLSNVNKLHDQIIIFGIVKNKGVTHFPPGYWNIDEIKI
jgi:hypothetical protein